jgi:hypothetical protein
VHANAADRGRLEAARQQSAAAASSLPSSCMLGARAAAPAQPPSSRAALWAALGDPGPQLADAASREPEAATARAFDERSEDDEGDSLPFSLFDD